MKEMMYHPKMELELLANGNCHGYEYAIVSFGTHPCAYVKLPENHTCYGKDYDEIPVICHGGLTYAESRLRALPESSGWWIGWDYAHAGDYCSFIAWSDEFRSDKKWTVSEMFEEVKEVIRQLQTISC